MRPAVPDVLPSPPRKPSLVEQAVPPWSDNQAAAPTTFFLARQRDGDDASASESPSPRDSMYGVQSLEETISHVDSPASMSDGPRPASDDNDSSAPAHRRCTLKPSDFLEHDERVEAFSPSAHVRISPDVGPSRSLSPIDAALPEDPLSLPSSPKSTSTRSLKPLDDISISDEISSQAIASGGEEEEPLQPPEPVHDSASQLIMPSIRMPSRRPFTDRGKSFGRFKILVAGAPGSGKSSLIRSIVQACEDIVHVDPMEQPRSSEASRSRSRSGSGHKHAPSAVTLSEIYASTKPYPSWWSDLEDSRVLRRRRSTGEVVLERNLCFVDTTLGSSTSRTGQIHAIAQYMRQQLARAVAAVNSSNNDLQNLLGGNGGSQVDAVLYLISQDTLATDIDCMSKLCELSNVIPLISKADLLSPSQIDSLKRAFHAEIQKARVRPFLFGETPSQEQDSYDSQPPFAVSSAKSSDDENMDASILMSPDYVQPLVPSELQILIEKMFDRDHMAWLRHSAARKLMQSRDLPTQQPHAIGPSTWLRGSTSPGGSISPQGSVPHVVTSYPVDGSSSYTMARVADYTQREEKLAQVRLAKWAADLQQSLQNERERYAALARGERAVWLTERLHECVVDGTLVPITQTPGFPGWSLESDRKTGSVVLRTSSGQHGQYRLASLSPHDPLGLVQWNEDLRRRGWIIIQVVGSFGVVGGLALWLAKFWGLPSQNLSEWRFNWFSSGH